MPKIASLCRRPCLASAPDPNVMGEGVVRAAALTEICALGRGDFKVSALGPNLEVPLGRPRFIS